MKLILASTSPRRRDLMRGAGYDFEIVAPDAVEICEGDPFELVVQNATLKALSISGAGIIIGADTLVLCNGEVLGKPVDREDAGRMISLQMRHPQEVITGLCVREGGKKYTGYESTMVEMYSCEDIGSYIDSGLWRGKAGGYGLQDRGPVRAEVTYGTSDNVIGLPLSLLRRLLSLTTFSYPGRTPS